MSFNLPGPYKRKLQGDFKLPLSFQCLMHGKLKLMLPPGTVSVFSRAKRGLFQFTALLMKNITKIWPKYMQLGQISIYRNQFEFTETIKFCKCFQIYHLKYNLISQMKFQFTNWITEFQFTDWLQNFNLPNESQNFNLPGCRISSYSGLLAAEFQFTDTDTEHRIWIYWLNQNFNLPIE